MRFLILSMTLLVVLSCNSVSRKTSHKQRLVFPALADKWDEAMPLGNGMVGNLVWQKKGKLRFSLDRADLWDLRPMANIDFKKWTFEDVYQHWKDNKYEKVQAAFDTPYNQLPAPSKIPAGGIEFDVDALGTVKNVSLDLETAACVVEWDSGATLTTFVHANQPIGWYKFENIKAPVKVTMTSPAYNRENEDGYTSQSRNDLNQLGYEQGAIEEKEHAITYNQKGWGDFAYQIHTSWNEDGNSLVGCWSVSSENKGWAPAPKASSIVTDAMSRGVDKDYASHLNWWRNYWGKSDVQVPDSILQHQYEMEIYKFGSVARDDAPPISLQAVWTADHGKLPPWKGDFHHDLNTQLSYWPSYAGNYLELEEGYLNWLWKYRSTFKRYTKEYFGVNGMNVPGVCTLDGEPMGGWIQYSFGQTVSAWLGHHFYLHWRFSMDRKFLEEKAYPWIKDVAIFLDEVAEKTDGKRKLKISSSPEIFDNSRRAWFAETTNYDLALIRWTYEKAAELAQELGLNKEAQKWTKILSEWPELAADPNTGLMFAPSCEYDQSHRHFSHQMAYHPLSLLDYSNGEEDQQIIDNTIKQLRKVGPDLWCGYSYSWIGNMYARAFKGEEAAEVLRTFSQCFCLKNSFHVNGDQCKAGHSKFHYRPFTLEGNFAFASAIQEMLIQSHTGIVKLFPAVPNSWQDASFKDLRAMGAFLISSELKGGEVTVVEITSEMGGQIVLKNPFKGMKFKATAAYRTADSNIIISLKKGEKIVLKR
ncbi:hypothetical protein EYV94_25680 [Puteibacter caeruleilacunae]|nr:hypothetical protein EYV94_25680 [Puteibacter caeruleilacunae]